MPDNIPYDYIIGKTPKLNTYKKRKKCLICGKPKNMYQEKFCCNCEDLYEDVIADLSGECTSIRKKLKVKLNDPKSIIKECRRRLKMRKYINGKSV